MNTTMEFFEHGFKILFDDKMYIVNKTEKTVSCPQSVNDDDYPNSIKNILKEGYFKQLTIE